jgi:hypothetical protein
MKFDPEAGALKNVNSERAVPLHPAIVTSGFLEFVASQHPGPLFPGLAADRFGNRGGNGTKIIGRWVRGLGLTRRANLSQPFLAAPLQDTREAIWPHA